MRNNIVIAAAFWSALGPLHRASEIEGFLRCSVTVIFIILSHIGVCVRHVHTNEVAMAGVHHSWVYADCFVAFGVGLDEALNFLKAQVDYFVGARNSHVVQAVKRFSS